MESKEIAFLGKMAAGVTHELKNVLAIINESNGLMADLIAFSGEASFPYREKFLRSINKIDEQVRRGVEITARFNRFAHSMDHPVANIDLSELVTQTVALGERFARLRNVELKVTVADKPVMLSTDPFRLQMALSKAIEACTCIIGGKGAITLRVLQNRELPSLDVRCEGESCEISRLREIMCVFGQWLEFEELASILGISVRWGEDAAGGFTLEIAKKGPERRDHAAPCT